MNATDESAVLRPRRFDLACEQIAAFLAASLGEVANLDPGLLDGYRPAGRHFLRGWEFGCDFDGARIGLRVLVDQDFPFSSPRIGLVEPHSIDGAHIESGSLLCLPLGQVFAWDRPAEALALILSQANDVITNALSSDDGREETRREIIAYWRRDGTDKITTSYLEPVERARRIFRLDDGKRIDLFDNRADAKAFLKSGGRELKPTQFGKRAHLIWLRKPPAINELPATVGDLIRLLLQEPVVGLDDLARQSSREKVSVILGFADADGRGFIGAELPKLAFQRDAPVQLPFVRDRSKAERLARLRVRRADPEWVFGRDGNAHAALLQTKSVVMIGAGSLGSYVAQQLASAGVGRLTIIDPEVLTFENTSRHILGAEAVDAPKAQALARRLQRQFRTSEIKGISSRWQDWALAAKNDLQDFDLVLCTMGDWPQEVHLTDYFQTNPTNAALMFAWLEPHAIASQAVVLPGSSPCLCCGFDTKSEPLRQMSEWPTPTRREVPLCGGQYQPYGAAALCGHAAAICEAALQFLTGQIEAPTHFLRSAGDPSLLGGRWRDWWSNECGDQDIGQRSRVMPWPKSDACLMCGPA